MTNDSNKDKHQARPGVPEHFEQIDPNKKDQHSPAGNKPDRDDENLKGAQKQHDVIPDVEMTKPTGNSPQPGQPGESAAGGFEEGPMNTNKPGGNPKK